MVSSIPTIFNGLNECNTKVIAKDMPRSWKPGTLLLRLLATSGEEIMVIAGGDVKTALEVYSAGSSHRLSHSRCVRQGKQSVA